VTYDDRGTGGSAPLACSSLEGVNANATFDQFVALIGTCGDSLGPTRDYYATRDNAQDMETIRNALGVDKLAIWGTSYGTQQALAYASAFPTHVERLLLDSTVAPDGRDPFAGAMLRNIPAGLSALCANSLCAAATSDAAGEAVTLANRLAATPVTGTVRRPGARPYGARLDGLNYLMLVVSSDLNPGIAAALPAATHAALVGHPKALLRLSLLAGADGTGGSTDSFDSALSVATTCADGPSPWPADTPLDGRKAMLDGAVAALPPGALGPFGPWAAALGTASSCLAWPTPAKRAPLPTGPLPDVPVLVLSGEQDIRTPTADARTAVARFPHGQLLVVPGSGHSVLGSDFSGCALNGVWRWLANKQVTPCKRGRRYFAPLAGYLSTLASARPAKGVAGNRGRTLTAVGRTLRDAEAVWLTTYTYDKITGLTGGVLDPGVSGSLRLRAYSDVPGVSLTGTLKLKGFGTAESWTGTVTISGSAAAHGVLHVNNRKLAGTLAGKRVTATA
jgi:pimeloyl-ACP methyl ester carboxylesterase